MPFSSLPTIWAITSAVWSGRRSPCARRVTLWPPNFSTSPPKPAPTPPPRPDDGSVTLGYVSGTPTHDADLASIAESLAAILRDFPQTRLLFVGPVVPPPIVAQAAGEERIRRVPLVPWNKVLALKMQIDVNLAPLDLTRPFNHAKSEIKFLEAGTVRVPTIAAASAGFREALSVDPAAGLLAASTDDWFRLLKRMVTDASARSEAGERAHAFVHRFAVVETHRDAIAAIFTEFAALPRTRPATPKPTLLRRNPLAPKNAAKRVLHLLRGGR